MFARLCRRIRTLRCPRRRNHAARVSHARGATSFSSTGNIDPRPKQNVIFAPNSGAAPAVTVHSTESLHKHCLQGNIMNAVKTTFAVATLMCASTPAFAHDDHGNCPRADHGHWMQSQMKRMDTNHDGVISKDEFMTFHEAKWNSLPKNRNGMVELSDMHMMYDERHDKMTKDDDSKRDDD
jgi:hypothetical protein